MKKLLVAVALLMSAPLQAQGFGLVITTKWTVQAYVNNIPTGARHDSTSTTEARAAAQQLCTVFPAVEAAKCLADLKNTYFYSLTAQGPKYSQYFLINDTNIAGGNKSYIVITSQRD
jgi:hypothetical protein